MKMPLTFTGAALVGILVGLCLLGAIVFLQRIGEPSVREVETNCECKQWVCVPRADR